MCQWMSEINLIDVWFSLSLSLSWTWPERTATRSSCCSLMEGRRELRRSLTSTTLIGRSVELHTLLHINMDTYCECDWPGLEPRSPTWKTWALAHWAEASALAQGANTSSRLLGKVTDSGIVVPNGLRCTMLTSRLGKMSSAQSFIIQLIIPNGFDTPAVFPPVGSDIHILSGPT